MQTLLLILSVALIFLWVWRKAGTNQKLQDDILALERIIRGQDAALKLKRAQEAKADEEARRRDLETAQKIRDAGDARRADEFLRESGAGATRAPGLSVATDPPADSDPEK